MSEPRVDPAAPPVVLDTHADLRALAERYPDSPRDQIRKIYLMGLEREQIVAVAYHQDTLRGRLEALSVDDETRSTIRHAMRWVWREEEMHTTYVRGVLLRIGDPILRARAFLLQGMGAVGGWATSVLHHVRWREAPVSRLWAHLVIAGGWIAGRVPRSITRDLRQLSFAEFCRFSLNAERTAALCWHRTAALFLELGEEAAARFSAQMATDEENHRQIFQTLVEAVDDAGGLREGWHAARLRARFAEVGPFYVARAHRADAATHPLGTGGRVVVVCADPGCSHEPACADAPEAALQTLLDRLGLPELLAARAASSGKPVDALRVAIKSTFMRAYHHADPSVITSPALLAELVRRLREHGCADVALLESASIYDWHYHGRDVGSVAAYLGLDFPGVRVVDVEEDLVAHRLRRGMVGDLVCATWRDADLRIAFGKLSTHPVDQVYLGVGQLEALCPQADENVFLDRPTHRGPATMALLGDFPPHLALLDAYDHVPDGLGGIIACPEPRTPRRLYGGLDAVAVDAVAARHMGLPHLEDLPNLETAMHWFADPRPATAVEGCDQPIRDFRGACHDELSTILSFLAHPVYVLVSGRGRLFAPEMDHEAFPGRRPTPWMLGLAQRVVRRLLGTRRPR